MYVIAKCPKCKNLQIVECRDLNHLQEIRTKCRKCNRSFKILYKNKPSWQGNLAVIKAFNNFQEAREEMLGIKRNL